MLAVVGDRALSPQRSEDRESFFEDRGPLAELEPERRELPAHAKLRVAHAGAEYRPSAAQVIKGCPLQGQIQRIARRGDQAGGAELDRRGPLGKRRQKTDWLESRLGKEAIADPN